MRLAYLGGGSLGATELKERTFDGCVALATVSLPASLRRIGTSAFNGCISLSEIALPGHITDIGASAFSGCIALAKIELPQSLQTLDSNVFSGCTALEAVDLPDGLKKLGSALFKDCVELKEIIIPPLVTDLPDYLFSGCVKLEKVTILGEEVAFIGAKAFYECESLNRMDVPDTVTIIGQNAFGKCPYLFGISVPDTAIKMGHNILLDTPAIIGFNADKEMVAKKEAGEEVDLDAYSNPELGHMVFYFDYRTKYQFVEMDMWTALRDALPERCPHCGSTKIKSSGKTIYSLAWELSAATEPISASFICYDKDCGAGFTHTLEKTPAE